MTLPPVERYSGREQAYVKHYFLATYLERLIHKVAASFDQVVYLDGFSGPWQSADEDYADTSFGIALKALRTAKTSWTALGRDVVMKAILVEKRKAAYNALQALQSGFPDVIIEPISGDFRVNIDKIIAAIPPRAFAFMLIDPKGWRIPMAALAPLLTRPNSEILFNFMFEFINRAASMQSPIIVHGLDELLPVVGWREALAELDLQANMTDRSVARKRVLLDAFRRVLREHGNYRYVADVEISRPLRDRVLYSLVYATRSEHGIQVFRDCQIKTLAEQENTRDAAKVAATSAASGQTEMFGTNQRLAPDLTTTFLASERMAATRMLLDILATSNRTFRWSEIWPKILERHAVRLTDLNVIAAKLRKDGVLNFPEWTSNRKRKPEDSYRLTLAAPLPLLLAITYLTQCCGLATDCGAEQGW